MGIVLLYGKNDDCYAGWGVSNVNLERCLLSSLSGIWKLGIMEIWVYVILILLIIVDNFAPGGPTMTYFKISVNFFLF